jgi:hypothetical protein
MKGVSMKATFIGLAAVLLAGAAVASASAAPPPGRPQAPDACGPGRYAANCCGQWYGPNYCLRPCYPPFNGLLPAPPRPTCNGNGNGNGNGGDGPGFGGIPVFPTHPFARSPRDFFMLDP